MRTPGNYALRLPASIGRLFGCLRADAASQHDRSAVAHFNGGIIGGVAKHERIQIDERVCHGKPVIRGTRVPVTVVVGSLAGGMSFDEVHREYDITAADIRAALRFVGELVEQESFHPLPAA